MHFSDQKREKVVVRSFSNEKPQETKPRSPRDLRSRGFTPRFEETRGWNIANINREPTTPNTKSTRSSNMRYDFQRRVYSTYSKFTEVKLVTIGIASPLRILQWAEKTLPNGKIYGEVLNANTLHHKTFKPQKGGLFCERIFGPIKDFECSCGRIDKSPKYSFRQFKKRAISDRAGYAFDVRKADIDNNVNVVHEANITPQERTRKLRKFCPNCDVEHTWSVIRRYQLGYIKLNSPVTHVWFLKGTPSYLSILLDIKKRNLQSIVYGTETFTLELSDSATTSFQTYRTTFNLDSPSKIYSSWTQARETGGYYGFGQELSKSLQDNNTSLDKNSNRAIEDRVGYTETQQNQGRQNRSPVNVQLHDPKTLPFREDNSAQSPHDFRYLKKKLLISKERRLNTIKKFKTQHSVYSEAGGAPPFFQTPLLEQKPGTPPENWGESVTLRGRAKPTPASPAQPPRALGAGKNFPARFEETHGEQSKGRFSQEEIFNKENREARAIEDRAVLPRVSSKRGEYLNVSPRDLRLPKAPRALRARGRGKPRVSKKRGGSGIEKIIESRKRTSQSEKRLRELTYNLLNNQIDVKSNEKVNNRVLNTIKNLSLNDKKRFSLNLIYLLQTSIIYNDFLTNFTFSNDRSGTPVFLRNTGILEKNQIAKTEFPMGNTTRAEGPRTTQFEHSKNFNSTFDNVYSSNSKIGKISHILRKVEQKLPLELYIKVNLNKILQKKILSLFILKTWKNIYKKAYLKAIYKSSSFTSYVKNFSKNITPRAEGPRGTRAPQKDFNFSNSSGPPVFLRNTGSHMLIPFLKMKKISSSKLSYSYLNNLIQFVKTEFKKHMIFLLQNIKQSPVEHTLENCTVKNFKFKIKSQTRSLHFNSISTLLEPRTPRAEGARGLVGDSADYTHTGASRNNEENNNEFYVFEQSVPLLHNTYEMITTTSEKMKDSIIFTPSGYFNTQVRGLTKPFIPRFFETRRLQDSDTSYEFQNLINLLAEYVFIYPLVIGKYFEKIRFNFFFPDPPCFFETRGVMNSDEKFPVIFDSPAFLRNAGENRTPSSLRELGGLRRPPVRFAHGDGVKEENSLTRAIPRVSSKRGVPEAGDNEVFNESRESRDKAKSSSSQRPTINPNIFMLSKLLLDLPRAPRALGARGFHPFLRNIRGIRSHDFNARGATSNSPTSTFPAIYNRGGFTIGSEVLRILPDSLFPAFRRNAGGPDMKPRVFSKRGNKVSPRDQRSYGRSKTPGAFRHPVHGPRALSASGGTGLSAYQNLDNKKRLYNNVYTLSHRERWGNRMSDGKDWQIFLFYNTAPSDYNDQPIFYYRSRISMETYAAGVGSAQSQNHSGQTTRAPKARVRATRTWDFSELVRPINNSFVSGPGIIQQLLLELTLPEMKKLDKQNRLLLHILNKSIFKLKKQIQFFALPQSPRDLVSRDARIQDESLEDSMEINARSSITQSRSPAFSRKAGSRLERNAQIEMRELCKRRDSLIRRTRLVRKLFRKNSEPSSMILTVLPVLPPDLRPIVKMGNQIAASDLNRFYQRIIYRNDRLKKFLKDPATSHSYEMKYAQRLLQESVDNLIQNGQNGGEKDARGRVLKSLSDILKGKQGRFRQFLLGKRVDYSGRSVIVVGPRLKLYECGIPLEMALELYLPFLLKKILNKNYAKTVVGAKTLIKTNRPLALELLREIMQTSPVLLNRAPTLHRLGFQAFLPKLIEGRAILLHPLVCSAFNADFDGDQMAVHVPITVEARAEAWKLMLSRNNMLSPATGDPLSIPSQDMVLGCYYLTTNSNKSTISLLRGSGFFFNNLEKVLFAYYLNKIDLHALVWVKWSGLIENGNDQEEPVEIRLSKTGTWQELSYNYIRTYDYMSQLITQYISTTPGRILFYSLLQNL